MAIRMAADCSRPRKLFDLLCGSRYRWRETLRRFQASDWRCVGLAAKPLVETTERFPPAFVRRIRGPESLVETTERFPPLGMRWLGG